MPRVSVEHEQMRRQQILDAALVCFLRRGYHATSMEDIVRESGLSVGALYTYFSSKEELFRALADSRFEQTMEHFRAAIGTRGTLVERLERGIEFFFSALDQEIGPWCRLSLEFCALRDQDHPVAALERQRLEEIRLWLQELLEAGIFSGECRPDLDAAATAELLLAATDGLLMRWIRGELHGDRQRLRRAFKDLVSRLVLAAPWSGEAPAGSTTDQTTTGVLWEKG